MIDFMNNSWHSYDDTVILYKENSNDLIKFCHKIPQELHNYLLKNAFNPLGLLNYPANSDEINELISEITKRLPSKLLHPCSYVAVIFNECTYTIKSRSTDRYYLNHIS